MTQCKHSLKVYRCQKIKFMISFARTDCLVPVGMITHIVHSLIYSLFAPVMYAMIYEREGGRERGRER